ncbi:VOC family protein [Phenylobacterium sp. J426]|uniref:VOC family protein n=1 Tax=Phenylobacterium sp. J426 TaxID=2898439 RepID=UPI002150D958|nr:VOC family protein [Phenylobacterium sp. J426]MCR5874136.1 VOC family protein [Phenylobacterium sp. J426]
MTLITLGVDDLEAAVAFYRDGLGFPTEGIVGEELENGAVAFFDLQPGLKLALWPRTSLAADANIGVTPRSPSDAMLAHNVRSEAEADEVLETAKAAGAVITKPGQRTNWGGYSGVFQDPDGHLWEVAYNPQILPQD